MIDFTRESQITLTAAAKRLGLNPITLRRWAVGCNGRKLETAKLGGKVYTSLEAIQRFSDQSDDTGDLAGAGIPVRPRPSDDARRQLMERHGI